MDYMTISGCAYISYDGFMRNQQKRNKQKNSKEQEKKNALKERGSLGLVLKSEVGLIQLVDQKNTQKRSVDYYA